MREMIPEVREARLSELPRVRPGPWPGISKVPPLSCKEEVSREGMRLSREEEDWKPLSRPQLWETDLRGRRQEEGGRREEAVVVTEPSSGGGEG